MNQLAIKHTPRNSLMYVAILAWLYISDVTLRLAVEIMLDQCLQALILLQYILLILIIENIADKFCLALEPAQKHSSRFMIGLLKCQMAW